MRHCRFDEITENAVLTFQEDNGLDANGIVGYDTWEILLFKGRENCDKLTNEELVLVAELLDIEPAVLSAIKEIETGSRGGFVAPGKPNIIFEGHIFWDELKKRGINPETWVMGNENIMHPQRERKYYKGGLGEYDRLEQARMFHREAADASASWGMFQIMGLNFADCGKKSVNDFVEAMCASELSQLILSARFFKTSGLLPFLQAKDWVNFAKRHNEASYRHSQYDKTLATVYKSCQLIQLLQ